MKTDHRPWRMKQIWHDLLFAHWPVDVDELNPFIPNSLELDTHEGQAWISVVPFHMSGIRLRNMPPIPFTSKFAEINVRTYVIKNGIPGVFFFSLDAASFLAVKAARYYYYLPYYYANIAMKKEDDVIYYQSNRLRSSKTFEFVGSYKPTSSKFTSKKGTLAYWLMERYCFYTSHKNRLYRCDIRHEPWELQLAEGEISSNTIADINGLKIPTVKPLMHYSEKIEVLTWELIEVKG